MPRSNSSVLERDIMSRKRDSQEGLTKIAFGERFAAYAKMTGMPDRQLAKLSAVSTSAFARYKAGAAIPPADDLFRLADVFRTTPRHLLFGDAAKGTSLIDAADADWVQIPRYSLNQLNDTGKGDAIETIPYRKDWLNRRLGTTVGLWITDLLSDYGELGLEEGDAIICSDIDLSGPAEKWICIFRGSAGPFVAKYSNRGGNGDYDDPTAIFVTASDLQGDVYTVARVRARMLARV